MIEDKEYDVTVTITFSTNVGFAPIERERWITSEDALEAFYGYGLDKVLDSGEYGYSVDSISVKEPQECRESNVVMSDTDPKGQK